jgi:hypothetical protein
LSDEAGNRVDLDFQPDYLFEVDRFSDVFWTIAGEMAQLNNYCALCTVETARYLSGLGKELKSLRSGKERCVTPDGDYSYERIESLEEGVETWQSTYSFITKATCLLMLSAFLEKSLWAICKGIAPHGRAFSRSGKRGGESEVGHYLRFLHDECGLAFTEPPESIAARESCRHIRNDFAHGDWDKVRERVATVQPREAFRAVAVLLKNVENSAWDSAWGQTATG